MKSTRDLSTGEAARLVSLSVGTIIRACDDGKLKSYRVPGSRIRRIPESELRAFAQANGLPWKGQWRAPA